MMYSVSLSTSNKQIVQTLLLQITSQLQALAAISPATMKQIQFQILAATLPPTSSQAIPSNLPQQAPSTWDAPATDTASLLSSFQLPTHRQVQSVLSTAVPASAGIHNAIPFGQAPAPLYQCCRKTSSTVSTKSSTSSSSISAQPPISNLIQHVQTDRGSLPGKRMSDPPTAQSDTLNTGNNSMEDFLKKLRQRHAEAIEQARREQAAERGQIAKKQKKNSGNSGIVISLPFEQATTESSGSGCTTNEGSTSSMENVIASDETRNDGSTSSNSSSEEDDTESGQIISRKPSIPLRKRFRSEKNGGITRRNLADHDHRMAEEMKNQDKK